MRSEQPRLEKDGNEMAGIRNVETRGWWKNNWQMVVRFAAIGCGLFGTGFSAAVAWGIGQGQNIALVAVKEEASTRQREDERFETQRLLEESEQNNRVCNVEKAVEYLTEIVRTDKEKTSILLDKLSTGVTELRTNVRVLMKNHDKEGER